MPATNATSERSFSTLRRIKNYLRNTMTQGRLNHIMMLNCHQEITDAIDIEKITNNFICASETRKTVFAMF